MAITPKGYLFQEILFFRAFPFRVGLSAISFLLCKAKKDAAVIPNAAFKTIFTIKYQPMIPYFCQIVTSLHGAIQLYPWSC